MEIVGYILGGINVFIGIIIAIIRSIDDLLLESKNNIKNEINSSYTEFGNITSGETVEMGRFESSIDRLKRLHYSISKDVPFINTMEWFLSKTVTFVVIIIVLALLSLILGTFVFKDHKYKEIFTIYIPFILFLVQLISLTSIIHFERYLKRLNIRYRNLEY
ncbi:MAG: hypothetical protein ACFFDN_23585 [Candidatus Hodarchaeota archaeon]